MISFGHQVSWQDLKDFMRTAGEVTAMKMSHAKNTAKKMPILHVFDRHNLVNLTYPR